MKLRELELQAQVLALARATAYIHTYIHTYIHDIHTYIHPSERNLDEIKQKNMFCRIHIQQFFSFIEGWEDMI
jgi:hypothetical protein